MTRLLAWLARVGRALARPLDAPPCALCARHGLDGCGHVATGGTP
jgi:hypothetical protein